MLWQQLCKQEGSEGLCPHIKSSGQCFFLHKVCQLTCLHTNIRILLLLLARSVYLHCIFQRDLVELIRQAFCKLGLDIIPEDYLLPSDKVIHYYYF